MARWTKAFPSYSTLYTYLDVDNWTVGADRATFDIAGGVTSPYYWNVNGLTVEVGWWESGTYHAINSSTTSYNRNGGDVETYSAPDFFGRQEQDRTVYLYAEGTGGGTAYAESSAFTVPHLPGAPSGLTASRAGDNRIDLAWTNPSLSYDAMCIEVSIDGGSWSECAVLWNTATSYSYTAASADHIYRFRIRSFYRMAYSAYTAETPAISTSPAAPTAISTAAIQGSTNVAVTLENASGSATGIEWQFSADGSTWGASTSVSGSPVTSFTASGIVGSGYIRVRNTNAVGSSAWLVSQKVTTICPPAAPTLRTPEASYVDMADGAVVLSWLHNSLDGSAQTAAQVEYEDLDYEEISDTRTISGNVHSYTLALDSEFAVGDRIRWRVRTKGADASYGPWSDYKTFSLFTAPTVSITSPGATIDGMPVELRATYSDMAGFTCQAATVSLTQGGRTLFTESADIDGSAITADLDVSEFLPANGESYTVVLTVRSSSGLTASANSTFLVDFTEPQAGELNITNDPETGYVSLLATFDNPDEQTYSGDTNTEYESEAGYVKSLSVEGKSEVVESKNLAPFYSASTTDRFWRTLGNDYTQLGDGWAGNMAFDDETYVAPQSWVDAAKTYTILIEFDGNGSYDFELYTGNVQLSFSSRSARGAVAGQKVEYRYTTVSVNHSQSNMLDYYVDCASGVRCRMSIYEGNYTGEYVPYLDPYIVSIEGVSVGDGTITTPLRSAGSVHDTLMADADSWTVERHVGVVDLGTLTWLYDSANTRFYTVNLASLIDRSGSAAWKTDLLCPLYTPTSGINADMTMSLYRATGYLYIRNLAYTSAADFKAAMSGVYLLYELATPTVDTETSMQTIEIGSAFTVQTDLGSEFSMATWDGLADAESISVSRVNPDGTLTPLITDGASGAGVVDRYAPLNTDYQYAVTTQAASKAVSTVYVAHRIESPYWFAYWGENVARARWNPSGGVSVTRPEKKRVHYVGREYPVSYDSLAIDEQSSLKFTGFPDEASDRFIELMRAGGRGVYKGCDGSVFNADFEYSTSANYTSATRMDDVNLTVTRIDGGAL